MKLRFKIKRSPLRSHSKFLLSLENENSLSPIFSVKMGRPFFITAILAIVLLSGVLWYCLLRFTPMRNTLPPRLDKAVRASYVELVYKVDSLSALVAMNNRYTSNIEMLLGDSIPVAEPSVAIPDSLNVNFYNMPLDSLMEAGSAESRFVRQFEASERFNLSVLSPIAAEGMVFYPPVSGIPLNQAGTDMDLPSLTASAAVATPVSATYRGTVIDAYYTAGKGVTVVIQHPNNFISQYSGLGDTFVARGAKVRAGERIGMSAGERYPLTFMLWHEGTALDPAKYVQTAPLQPSEQSEPFMPSRKR